MTDIFKSADWARRAGEVSGKALLASGGETIGSALVADIERSLDNGGDPSLTHTQWRMLLSMAKLGLKSA